MRKTPLSWISALIVVAAAALAPAEEAPTYAQRLGWGPQDRVVIFHTDDVGMSHSMNRGAFEAYENGLATSASVMMPCPWVPEVVEWLRTRPGADFGLHLTLTSEWKLYRWGPLAGAAAVPGLVDPEGCLWKDVASVLQHATPDEIEREIRAQIERAERMGFNFTHLDSHMGTLFASPEYFKRYMKVGIEKQVPILMAGGRAPNARRENPVPATLLAPLAEEVWNAGLPVIDDIHTASYNWKDKEEKTGRFVELLAQLEPGITEVIIHCAMPDETLPVITSSTDVRHGDFLAMMSSELRRAVEESGVILTNWTELMDRRRAAGRAE